MHKNHSALSHSNVFFSLCRHCLNSTGNNQHSTVSQTSNRMLLQLVRIYCFIKIKNNNGQRIPNHYIPIVTTSLQKKLLNFKLRERDNFPRTTWLALYSEVSQYSGYESVYFVWICLTYIRGLSQPLALYSTYSLLSKKLYI